MTILKAFYSGRLITSCRPGLFSFLAAGIICLTFLAGTDALAQGNLLITPRRVVFEGNKRSFDLNLANTGQDTAVYAISLIQIRMKDDGTTEQITQPDTGQNFADKYIRFFPRSVTLGPGESQAVKVQLIRTGDLVSGEYRSHFYFRAVPNAKPLGEEEAAPVDTTTIAVRITPIFGITIPVIIRIGESNGKVNLTNLRLEYVNDTLPRFSFTFSRSGNFSVYGNITVDHIAGSGKATRVAAANGIAVYTPNTVRTFHLNLSRIPGVDFKSGKLRIVYSAPSDLKPEKYAESELQLH